MKHYILLYFLLIYCSNTAFAQYDYYKTYTGTTDMRFEIVQLLETYNETTVASGNFLASLNKQGRVNWSKRFYQDTAFANVPVFSVHYDGLAATPDGGFIGIASPHPEGIVTRFDSLGNQIWSKSFDRPNEGISFKRIFRTSNDEYILLFRSYTPPGVLNSEWLKMDGNGNVIWHRCYQAPNAYSGSFSEFITENSLGYLIAQRGGNVYQTDFNGNILWLKNYNMLVKNIFSVSNNDYILVGYLPGYTNQVWMRVSNSGTVIWTKVLPYNLGWQSVIFFFEGYKQLSDENLLDIRVTPSLSLPNTADILIAKLNVQNGEVLWGKRYYPNIPVYSPSYVKDYSVITDSTFNMFPITNLPQITAVNSHFIRLNIGYNPDTSGGCPIQDVTLLPAYNAAISSYPMQPLITNKPFTIQDTILYWIDEPIADNVQCQNGIAADFEVSNHLLCVGECLSIVDTSSGDITNWEWTFFGTDTTYHYTKYPPSICYADSGVFSIQLVVSNSYLSDTLRKTIRVFQLPEIDLGQDTTICQGEFIAQIFQIPYANFSWNNGASTPYLFANSSGTYIVEVTAATCFETDTLILNVINKPIVNLGADSTFCFVDSLVLDATISSSPHTYLWQDNSTAGQFSATSSGLYSVTVTDTFGCSNTDDILIDLNNFSYELGNDTAICQGEILIFNVATTNGNYLWNDGSTDSVLTVNNSGIYTVEVTANGCSKSDTISVIVHDLPIVDLGTDTIICHQNGLNLIANTSNNVNYLWQNNATTPNIFINNSGIYSLLVTDNLTNCQASDTVDIQFIQDINIELGNDTAICQGEILTFNVATPNGNYLWNDGSTDSVLVVNSSGIYTVEVNISSCVKYDTISVIVHDLPMVDLGTDTVICHQNGLNLIANTSNNVNYLWQNNATTPNIFINNSGIYSLLVTNNLTNCQASDTVDIQFIPVDNFELGNDTLLCEGQNITLNAFVPNANYLWNDGSQTSNLTVNNSGLYTVEVSIAACFAMDSIEIIVISPMDLDLGEDEILCDDEIQYLNVGDTNVISYLWQDNSTQPFMDVTQAGTYFVTLTYNATCEVSDTVNFTAEGEIYPTLPNDTIICEDNRVTLNAYQPNAISYQWEAVEAYYSQHNLQDSVIIATLPGEYKVTISNGCSTFTQTILIEEEDCGCYPYVPNAFSPNNDGVNDFFEVYTNCILSNYNLKIFDRWGGILFETDDINEGWEGTKQGQTLKNGVYVWVLTYESPNERGILETFVRSGSVTLMR